MPDNKPLNILLISSDQHRFDAMGCAKAGSWLEDVDIQTPHLDRLSAEGVRFNNAVCNFPVCMASRHSFITGMYGYQIGANRLNVNYFPDQLPVPTLGHHLHNAGYRTAAIGKMHWKPFQAAATDLPDTRGFEVRITNEPTREDPAQLFYKQAMDADILAQLAEEARAARGETAAGYVGLVSEVPAEKFYDRWLTDHAETFIDNHDDSQPFMLFLSLHNPHAPGIIPPEFDGIYDPGDMPLPPPAPDGYDEEGPFLSQHDFRPQYLAMSDDDKRTAIARYLALVTMVDDCVGRMLAALERNGYLENTLIVYISDHGELLGEHVSWTKYCSYDSAIRVPFIVRWPGRTAETSDAPVELVDLVPLCLDAAGINPPDYLPGRSPRLLLDGETPADWRPGTFTEFRNGTDWTMRIGQYKLIERSDTHSSLYDLKVDPGEYVNVIDAPEYAGVLAELRHALLQNTIRAASRYPHLWVYEHATQDRDMVKSD